MSAKRSLQRDIWAAITILISVTVLSITVIALVTSEHLERDLLRQTVTDELKFVDAELRQNRNIPLPHTGTLQVWLDSDDRVFAPAPFQKLEVGEHHSVEYLQRSWHVLRSDTEHGRLTVAADVSLIEQRERLMALSLVATSLVLIALAMLVGRWLSLQLARPAERLSQTLRQIAPDDPEPLAGHFSGKELASIAESVDDLRQRNHELLNHERLFSAAASHELRTPLAIIQSSLELLGHETLSEAATQRMDRANRATLGLSELIESLIHLARPSEDMTQSPEPLVPLVEAAIQQLKQRWPQTEVTFRQIAQPVIPATTGLLRVVVNNLLRNAAQHGARGADAASVNITITTHRFIVQDNGPGLPDSGLQDVLKPYVSSNALSGDSFGLGLYIVHRVCERHGWRLSEANVDEQGACLVVDFARYERSPN